MNIDNINDRIDFFVSSKWSVFLIIFFASLIVLPNMGRESLWFDEIFSATASLKVGSLQQMFYQYIFKDVHPPLYQLLLYFWGHVIGGSDFILRFLNYIFFVIGILYSYFLLKEYIDSNIAFIYLAISSFTPGVLYYIQEVRSYELLFVLSSIATIYYIILIKFIKKKIKVEYKYYVIFSTVSVLLMYTHFFGYLIVFSLWVSLLCFSIIRADNRSVKNLLLFGIFVAIVGITWLITMFCFSDITSRAGGRFWTSSDAYNIFAVSGIAFGNKYAIIFALLIAFITFLKYRKLIDWWYLRWITLPAFLTIVVACVISLNAPIITSNRNLMVIVPLVILFFSYMFFAIYAEDKLLFALFVLMLLGSSVFKNFTYQKQNWRDASKYILTHYSPSDCYIPTNKDADKGAWLNFIMYPSYYIGNKFTYKNSGPIIQKSCSLIFITGHSQRDRVVRLLAENNISSYEILDYHNVYVVKKK